ncbi:MAG: DUF3617 domain-containing protein [Leptothrix sp. (in: Bacteria)]|nr:DUF3617 domain-containing protein [Leptothrix sp. (in: b-proteobacteria)]
MEDQPEPQRARSPGRRHRSRRGYGRRPRHVRADAHDDSSWEPQAMKTLSNCLAPTYLGLAIALAAPHAVAQKLSPGLWEHSVTMKTSSGRMEAGMARMQEQLAAMPPEKRKQLEAMMGRQGMGMGMGQGAGQPMVVKVCLTPEQAARDEMPQADANCRQLSQERSGKTVRFKFACTGERQSSGEGEYTLDSDKAHHGRTLLTTVAQGRPERMEMEHRARWLGASCGDVKPRAR